MLSCLTLFRIERKQHPEYWVDTIIKQLAHTWKVLRAARVAEQLLPCVPHIPMDAH